MSTTKITGPTEALAAYKQHMFDMKVFHHGRRRFDDLPWSRALASSRYKSGTDGRLAVARRMRARCKALKAWHASQPDLSFIANKPERAGTALLLKHIALTVEFDKQNSPYIFECDTVVEHRWTTDTERKLATSYGLLEAWARGEDVTLLRLAAGSVRNSVCGTALVR